MERSLLYVSRSLLDDVASDKEVETLVSKAQQRNAELAVTGALIFSSKGFAQVLEGTEEAIDALMESIKQDGRHTDIAIVHDRSIEKRDFKDWSMVYSGPSTYIARHLDPFLNETLEDPSNIKSKLIFKLMVEFGRG
jgi:uncharacterized protein YaaQ